MLGIIDNQAKYIDVTNWKNQPKFKTILENKIFGS